VVRAIVSLGSSLGKKVIAEGIETKSQLEQLREMGCEAGQGFHLSRPLSARKVDQLLDTLAQAEARHRPAAESMPSLLH